MNLPLVSDPSGPTSFVELVGFISCVLLGFAILGLVVLGLRCAFEHGDRPKTQVKL